MKKCNQCGQELESNAKFCKFCGGNEFSEALQENPPAPQEVRSVQIKKRNNKSVIISIISLIVIAGIVTCVAIFINKTDDKDKNQNHTGEVSVEEKAQKEESVSVKVQEDQNENQEPESSEEEMNLLDKMTASQLREVNIFLSNFSEVGYMRDKVTGTYGKIRFAYYHNLINNSGFSQFSDGVYYGIDEELLNNTLSRFFGESIPADLSDSTQQWIYEEGMFKFIPDNRETFNHFSIARTMTENPDGTLNVAFDVFDYGETDVKENDVYALDAKKATENFRLLYNGTAVLEEKLHNGKKTYEIADYTI